MSFKGQQEIPQDEGVGADDDEWVSVHMKLDFMWIRTFVSYGGNFRT